MNVLSVCSGIGAPECAWHPLGWRSVAFSEIDPFPSAVLAERFPVVPNWGDMTNFKEWPDADVDVLAGGTPCQSFSVAGLRAGLADARGNLALTYLAIADRYRPEWLVWENVPGVLSSDGGRDFGAILGAMGQLGYGWAYRVLDAQYYGVAQRRRRVFVVGHLGDWRRAAAVLFERESLSGHPAPRREPGKRVAGSLKASLGKRCGQADGSDARDLLVPAVSPALKARDYKGPSSDGDGDGDGAALVTVAHSLRGEGFDASEDGTGRGTPLVPVAIQEVGKRTGSSTTDPRAGIGISEPGAPMFTLQAGAQHGVAADMAVRRLTPKEAERLQGFPDCWTAITYRGKPAADGPRYKALGNSMAVPVLRWIGERIKWVAHFQSEDGR